MLLMACLLFLVFSFSVPISDFTTVSAWCIVDTLLLNCCMIGKVQKSWTRTAFCNYVAEITEKDGIALSFSFLQVSCIF